MKQIDRANIILWSLLLFSAALVAKAAYEQIYRNEYWSQRGQGQQYKTAKLPAPRGNILDETGAILVESRQVTRLDIAPKEVRSPEKLAKLLRDAHIEERWIARATDTARKWVEIPTLLLPQDAAQLVTLRGVYPNPIVDRVYANSAGIQRIVGRIDRRTREPLDGIELALDHVLRGDTSRLRMARDHSGRNLAREAEGDAGRPGETVVLTINRGLQDIAERALGDAMDTLGATGGDVVVMNPHTGAVLALASRRAGSTAPGNSAITEPYEPGSTLKPFIAGALLERKMARSDEVINTFNGAYTTFGRTIHDTHKEASMTLFDVIKYSSNIGIVRFSERFTPRQKYEVLRDAGFGTLTGITLPGEESGTLRPPVRWSKQSAASLAMGYEIAVTPLQLATAYAAIANGGELLEPQIVKEVRTPDGEVIYETRRRVVRRIMSRETANQLLAMMREVVEGGTSRRVELATLDVAGKSGTARRTGGGKGYKDGSYTASFVGVFPNDKPQYVILTKIDNPQGGSYYGGAVAGSITNVVLRAAFAARDASLNLEQLTASVHAPRKDTSPAARQADERARLKAQTDSIRRAKSDTIPPPPPAKPAENDPRTSATYVIKLPAERKIAPVASTVRPVPDITGLTVRQAVRLLHSAGFQVQLVPDETSKLSTLPAAGTPWMPGSVVKLHGSE